MTRWMILALASSIAACGGAPDEEITPPAPDTGWEPFAHGEHSPGELGVARFQIAPCAYPQMVGELPSCGLDLPFILGHRTAILVQMQDGAPMAANASASGGAIVVESSLSEGEYLRVLLTAAAPGDASLVVEGADGTQLDRIVVGVREASSVEISLDDGGEPALAIGQRATLRATPRSDSGEALNAYAELSWTMLDDTGALQLAETRGWRVDVRAQAAGGERLRTQVGSLAAVLELIVQ